MGSRGSESGGGSGGGVSEMMRDYDSERLSGASSHFERGYNEGIREARSLSDDELSSEISSTRTNISNGRNDGRARTVDPNSPFAQHSDGYLAGLEREDFRRTLVRFSQN